MGYVGLQIGYGRIRTLTDASVRTCQGDLKECKPTIMIGVPRIWETIRKGILNSVSKMNPLKKSVFRDSMSIKKANMPILSTIVDSVVFSQVSAQPSGRLHYVLNDGAALSVETQQFLSTALVTVLQGETFPGSSTEICSPGPLFRLLCDRVLRVSIALIATQP